MYFMFDQETKHGYVGKSDDSVERVKSMTLSWKEGKLSKRRRKSA